MKLPLWRLLSGLAIFALLFTVLALLAPTYFENYKLGRYVKDLAAKTSSGAATDDLLRTEVVTRAHELELPVQPGDIQIEHTGGKLQMHARYKVKFDLSLYPVDLHMSAP